MSIGDQPAAATNIRPDEPIILEPAPAVSETNVKPTRQPRASSLPEKPKPSQFLTALDWLADKGSIIGNWVIDFALVALGLISLSPEIWSAIAMLFLAFVLATFLVRALRQRNKGLYLVLVIVIGFFDVSAVMAFLDRQHQKLEHPGVDPRLVSLQNQTSDAQSALDALLSQQSSANNRKTLDNLDGQIRFAQTSLEEAKRRQNDYSSGGLMALAVDPRVLAMAIPNALTNSEIADKILLAVVIALFVALQWTLREAMGIAAKRERAAARTGETKKRGRGKGKGKPRTVATPAGLDLQDPAG